MVEINPCVASGCPGLCCQDIDLELTEPELKEIFPMAKEVPSINELADLKYSKTPGLYFIRNYGRPGLDVEGFCLLSINGPCPRRLPDGSCSVHERREHPAINFRIGCEDCNAIRKEHGLAPIFIEPVE